MTISALQQGRALEPEQSETSDPEESPAEV